jgi:hypothetical protein
MTSCELNWGQSFFILLSLVPTALVLAMLCVAKCVWKPMVDRGNQFRLPLLPYEFKYPFKTDTPITDMSGAVLEGTMVVDETPQGLVILTFNPNINEFHYWSDSDIQYRYLEAIARKYVQSFRCEHLYIDRLEELRKEHVRMTKKTQEEPAEIKKQLDKNIFATLKVAGTNTARQQKNVIVAKRANKYIKRGRFEECPLFKCKKPSKTKKIGYNDFKLFFEKKD